MKTIIGALLLSLPVAAASQTLPRVVVTDPTIKGKIGTATITTPTNDLLEGLSSPMGIAMLHTVRRSGMARSAIPFKANTPRRLSGHGYHIMIMHKLKPGTTLPMTLIFEHAGAVKVVFKVT